MKEKTQSEKQFFELVDAYYQKKDSQPYHLMCGIQKQFLKPGNEFYIWMEFKVLEQISSCTMSFEIIDSSENVHQLFEMKDNEFNANERFSFSFPGYVPCMVPYGEAVLNIRFSMREKVFYSYKIPLEIVGTILSCRS